MSDDRDLNRITARFVYGNPYKKSPVLYETDRKLQDFSTFSNNGKIGVRFERIDELVIDLLQTYDVAVGAVASLTHPAILTAMANLKHIAIVVQKEDFLRADTGEKVFPLQKKILRHLYDALTPFDSQDFPEAHPGQQEEHPDYNWNVQSWLFDHEGVFVRGGSAVRCLGFARSDNRASPNMHHKFLVFGYKDEGMVIRPRCVVSGSFNMTKNAIKSRENVLVVEDEAICQAYLSEWAQLWCLSEELDWSSPEPVADPVYVGT